MFTKSSEASPPWINFWASNRLNPHIFTRFISGQIPKCWPSLCWTRPIRRVRVLLQRVDPGVGFQPLGRPWWSHPSFSAEEAFKGRGGGERHDSNYWRFSAHFVMPCSMTCPLCITMPCLRLGGDPWLDFFGE